MIDTISTGASQVSFTTTGIKGNSLTGISLDGSTPVAGALTGAQVNSPGIQTPTIYPDAAKAAQYKPSGMIYWERPNVSTTAGQTTYVNNTAYALPAGTLVNNGDRLVFDVVVSIPTAAATDIKNCTAAIGYSAFTAATGAWTGGLNFLVASSASNAGQIHWHITGELVKYGATSTAYRWYSQWESGAANTTTTQSFGWTTDTSTITWANANNILFAVGNTTGANSQVLTIQQVHLTLFPYR
jgi:hypothetical protein